MAWSFHTGTHAPTFHAHVRGAFGEGACRIRRVCPPRCRAFDAAGAVLYDAALLYPVWKSISASTRVAPKF